MKRKLIALGIVSPLFLALCVVGVLLLGVTGWLVFRSDGPTPAIKKRATLGPLARFTPTLPPQSAGTADSLPAATELSPANAPAAAPPPTGEVKTTPGFELPPNTVSSVNPAGVATRLVIPKLNLDAPVMLAPIENQTWNVSRLGQAVGHLEGTAPPGSNSNIVLAGHITLAAGVYGPFAGLAQLAEGDEVLVYEGDKAFHYIVDGYQLVERTAIEVTQPTATGQITLITCSNWNRESNKYEQRIVVKGHLAQP
jgi:LPXTG-site transpeptidase (sortase) family protein